MRAEPVPLDGRLVRLVPLELAHVEPLSAVGLDADLWKWTWSGVATVHDMRRYVETALAEQAAGVSLPFAILERAGGRVIGSTRYGNIALVHRRLEIGWSWIARPWQRTGANVEAKLLLLTHAIETLGCQRVEFKTDASNEPSRRALLGIGATFEGIFRKHGVADGGRVRDTAWYSVVDDEWPDVKARLIERLRGR